MISCKGQQHSKEALTAIAETYLKEMGYGENPYLIIFHKDTENNHVHMVSTRIRADGKKVNDSFENKRSIAIIAQIMKASIKQEFSQQIDKAFSYNLSTEAQFRLLLEKQGYRVSKTKVALEIRKADQLQSSIPLAQIDAQIGKYKAMRKQAKTASSHLREIQKAVRSCFEIG